MSRNRINPENIRKQYTDVQLVESPYAALIRDEVIRKGYDMVLESNKQVVRNYAVQLVRDNHREAIDFALTMDSWLTVTGEFLPGAQIAGDIIAVEVNDYLADRSAM